MDNRSPAKVVKQLDTQINRLLKGVDLHSTSNKERKTLADLQQNLVDSRIYSNSYELSETREEQLQNASSGKKYLERASKNILAASESNIFSAIDVAYLSAQIEQAISGLK